MENEINYLQMKNDNNYLQMENDNNCLTYCMYQYVLVIDRTEQAQAQFLFLSYKEGQSVNTFNNGKMMNHMILFINKGYSLLYVCMFW